MENSALGQKVNELITKYKQAQQQIAEQREKILTLESTCAQQSAKINELEEDILNRSINDEELCKFIEQEIGLGQ